MPPLRFLLVATTLLGVLHLYLGLRLLPDLSTDPLVQAWGWGVLALSTLLQPLGLMTRGLQRERLRDGLAWAAMLAMGLFSSLFVFTVLRDLLWLLLAGLDTLGLPALPEGFGQDSAWLVSGVTLTVSALGLLNARRLAQVVEVKVPLAGLPPALHGFRIAQISDIHVGPTIKRDYLARIVARVNALEPDLVAITGDLVDGRVADLAPHTAPLAGLRARYGRFFVTGNHEYYSGAPEWIAELRRLGLTVLLNEHVLIRHGDAPLVVAGVTDYGAGSFYASHRSDPKAALAGAPAEAIKLLLAHQPRSAPAAAAAGFHLQISGHTHGGQFWPWNHFVPLQQPFTAGLHRLHSLWIYVSRGTGYWGPPKRFGAPSEITCLQLVPA